MHTPILLALGAITTFGSTFSYFPDAIQDALVLSRRQEDLALEAPPGPPVIRESGPVSADAAAVAPSPGRHWSLQPREASWLVGGLGCVAERGGLGCVAVLLRQRGARQGLQGACAWTGAAELPSEAHVLGQGGGILLNVLLAPKASPSGVWEVIKSTTKKYYL